MFNDDKELRLAFSSQYPTFLKHVAQAGYPFICHVASCLNWYKKNWWIFGISPFLQSNLKSLYIAFQIGICFSYICFKTCPFNFIDYFRPLPIGIYQ